MPNVTGARRPGSGDLSLLLTRWRPAGRAHFVGELARGREGGRRRRVWLGEGEGVTGGWQGDDGVHQAVRAPPSTLSCPHPPQHRGN